MSVSLYRWTEACDGGFCPGDCDLCSRNEEDEKEEENMKLEIMDYEGVKETVEVPANVARIDVVITSGDEALRCVMDDGRLVLLTHSTAAKCMVGYDDGWYTIFDREIGLDETEAWSKRTDSYDTDWMFN